MMHVATTVACALIASTAYAAAAPAAASPASAALAVPAMTVNVTAAPQMSPELVARILAEADAVWRPTGLAFVWQRAARRVVPYSRASETGPYVPKTLRLTIGDKHGEGSGNHLPLGWIVFDDVASPEQEIYLSLANAEQLMSNSRGVIGIVGQMPVIQRDSLLARAMGRALAHELGHYLLASKAHAPRGLMKAVLTATELFSVDAKPFEIEPSQRRAVAARLRGEPLAASR
jgi:hypothetical protein